VKLGSKLFFILEGAWIMGLELLWEREVGRVSLNGRHTCACSSHEISDWPGRVPVQGQHSDRGDPGQSSNRTAHSKHLNFAGLPALRKCCTGHIDRDDLPSVGGSISGQWP